MYFKEATHFYSPTKLDVLFEAETHPFKKPFSNVIRALKFHSHICVKLGLTRTAVYAVNQYVSQI